MNISRLPLSLQKSPNNQVWTQFLVLHIFFGFCISQGCSELCITAYLDNYKKCPVCSVEIEREFLIPNLALQSLQREFETKASSAKTKKSKSKNYSKEVIYSEFFKLLSQDRESRLSNLKLELERIEGLKNELGITEETFPTIGSKRRASNLNAVEEEKVSRLYENFDNLSSTFSTKIDWETFEKRLISATNLFSVKEIGSFRNCDPLETSSQIISSIEVDKSGGIFATAGVLKQIKLYKLETAIAARTRRNYPILEIKCDSKISCLSWNPFYEERLGSADYEGIVNLYDTGTGKVLNSWMEHEKRCWSIDTSTLDPQRIISGSDDCKVKLWSQKHQKSLLTLDIRSNVCSARFSPNDSNLIAVGAADHRVFLFDLRKPSVPLLNEKRHAKAVSYVRFSGNDRLISASTDSSLRSWSLSTTAACEQVVFKGHLNEKNFVGLSVDPSGGLVATGSEDNSVYIYDGNLNAPVLKCPMFTQCPLTGTPMEDEQSAFVSSVTWANQSDEDGNSILLAANSTGNMKIFSIIEE